MPSGFDWLLLDMEHSPNDLADVYVQLQAMMEGPTQGVVRVPSDDPVTIKRILDAGAQPLMIPNVEDAEQARRAADPPPAARRPRLQPGAARRPVRADRELPHALRGRAVRDRPDRVAARARQPRGDRGGRGGGRRLHRPRDLSTSLGYFGRQGHEDVVGLIEKALKRIVASGRAAGILTGDETLARRYMAAGSTYTAVGSDMSVLARATEALATRFKT